MNKDNTFSDKFKMKDQEGKDICYECGKVQTYGTMKDINQADFDIYCDKCLKKLKKKKIDHCMKYT